MAGDSTVTRGKEVTRQSPGGTRLGDSDDGHSRARTVQHRHQAPERSAAPPTACKHEVLSPEPLLPLTVLSCLWRSGDRTGQLGHQLRKATMTAKGLLPECRQWE